MKSVVAVVPNYNMGAGLEVLLPGLIQNQEYDEIVVVDDYSSDHSLDVAHQYGATVIGGMHTAGPAANRNRIINHPTVQKYGGALLHFVDADQRMLSKGNADTIRDIFDDERIGMAGGLVREKDGNQLPFNHGPLFTVAAHIGGALQLRNAHIAKGNPHRANKWRERAAGLLGEWPDTTNPRQARNTSWVVERNMVIPADLLKRIGGFPPVAFHEIQGVGLELQKRGMTVRYDPRLEVKQYLDEQPHPGRLMDRVTATAYLVNRYGIGRFLGMDGGKVR